MNRMHQVRNSLARTILFGALLIVAQEIGVERNRSLAAEDVSDSGLLSNAFRTAADRASSGLVTIYTLRGPRMTAMWRRIKEANNMRSTTLLPSEPHDQQGSGIVIDRQGLILTCNHVVESADALFVVLPDGRKFEPVDIRVDPATDLAVIRIEGAGELQEVQLGNSDSVQVGDWVVSLGNPYDLKQSVSAGIVSATHRWVLGSLLVDSFSRVSFVNETLPYCLES